MRSLRVVLMSLLFLTIQGLPAMAADIDPAEYFTSKTGDDWSMDATITLPNGKELKAIARRKIEDAVEKDGKKYFTFMKKYANGKPNASLRSV